VDSLEVHVDEQAWVRLAEQALPPAERERVMDHVVRCAECAAVWRAVDELQRRAPEIDPRLRRPSRRRILVWLPAFAAAAAVAFVVTSPRRSGPPPSSDPRRVGASSARPETLFPAAGTTLGTPDQLRFAPLAGARSHRVQVLSSDGKLLWDSSPVAGNLVAWPGSVRLVPGRYCWQVVALPEWGQSPADEVVSMPACFSVKGP